MNDGTDVGGDTCMRCGRQVAMACVTDRAEAVCANRMTPTFDKKAGVSRLSMMSTDNGDPSQSANQLSHPT